MDFDKEKFDLIISLGEDCACTSYLRKFNLQNASYPFDWLTRADFKTRIELLLTDFKDFLNKEDLKLLEKPKNAIVDNKCNYYENLKTGFYFYHDFYSDFEFNEIYDVVFEKYKRRIKRLYERIKKFIDNDNRENIAEAKISDKVIKLKYDTMSYDITNPSLQCTGNIALNDKIFSKLKYKQYQRNFLIRAMFNCFVKLPIAIFVRDGKKRHKIREEIKKRIFNLG